MSNMDHQGKGAQWNLKYEEGLPSLTEPDPFFLTAYEKFIFRRFPNGGRGLDLAGGLGRHALWLAARGWKVTVVDVSEVAIGKLGQEAAQLNIKLNLFAKDAAEYDFEQYDVIILFYHLDRRLFPKIVSALNPGGLFICKMAVQWGFVTTSSVDPSEPLSRSELVCLVPDLHVMEHQERPVRSRGVVEFVGRKP